jgi:nitrile hydratase
MAHDGHHDEHHARDHAEGSPLPEIALRVKALESILVEKGLVDPTAIDAIVETYETKIGPRNGAKVVAKAWSDPAYLERLREDATAAIAELGFTGRQGEHMVVVENTPHLGNRPGRHPSSSARSAPVTPGRCWVCRRSGTRRRPIVPRR